MSTFPFDLEPSDKIIFKSPKLGEEACSVTMKVVNITKEAQAFKIKCTNNDFFRLRPPTVNIPHGDKPVNITITFNPGKAIPENGKHYFAIYGTPLKGAENVKAAFATEEGSKVEPKRIHAYFTKEGGDDQKDGKKGAKEEKKDEKKEDKKDDKKEDKKDENKEEKKDDDKKEDGKKDEEKKDEKKK
ncbi:MSP domain and PapD-like domain-containing protein [Strongyloides ratti]|uniref:Major sperm protein n=1 Tax=Strongyloides ratti TaxID=34506 RepID=A0A090L5A9_STRRB|nr:MSP domain and PapD-like domain-containing protein [Strongyloides ratti]CEF64912.1 MSP domain and PapD-like domain-containing protein [Strongyloides ratti]